MNFLYLNRLYKDIMNIYGNKNNNNYMNNNYMNNNYMKNSQTNNNYVTNNHIAEHFNHQMPPVKGSLPYVRLPNVNYNAVNQYYKDRIKSFLYKQI